MPDADRMWTEDLLAATAKVPCEACRWEVVRTGGVVGVCPDCVATSGSTPRRPTVADHDGRPMTRTDDREALLMCFACGKPAYSRQQERCLNCGADREEQEMADYDPMVQH